MNKAKTTQLLPFEYFTWSYKFLKSPKLCRSYEIPNFFLPQPSLWDRPPSLPNKGCDIVIVSSLYFCSFCILFCTLPFQLIRFHISPVLLFFILLLIFLFILVFSYHYTILFISSSPDVSNEIQLEFL